MARKNETFLDVTLGLLLLTINELGLMSQELTTASNLLLTVKDVENEEVLKFISAYQMRLKELLLLSKKIVN